MTRRTYRHVLTALAGGALLLAACESETKLVPPPDASTEDTSTTPDATVEEDTKTGPPTHQLTSSAKYGWKLPATAPTPNPECKPPTAYTHQDSLPWQGFEYKGTLFTCNTCPGGLQSLQGEWKAMGDPNAEDPTVPFERDPTYRETFVVKGNRFTMHLAGEDLGTQAEAWIEGWYFCGSKPEIDNENKVFVVTKVSPEGAFGWEAGLTYSADILGEGASIFRGYHEAITTSGNAWIGSLPYCRIGSEFNGIICPDPFAE